MYAILKWTKIFFEWEIQILTIKFVKFHSFSQLFLFII